MKRPYSQENELICWRYDHNEGEVVKGVNLLSAVLATDELSVHIAGGGKLKNTSN